MKIYAGNTYLNGFGESVRISNADGNDQDFTTYPFAGDDGQLYTEDGRIIDGVEKRHDLVCPWSEEDECKIRRGILVERHADAMATIASYQRGARRVADEIRALDRRLGEIAEAKAAPAAKAKGAKG